MALAIIGLTGLAPIAAAQELIYGMTAASNAFNVPGTGLMSFQSNNLGATTNIGAFTGVVANHGVRSIDFRPSTGQLYAISTDSTGGSAQLYTVNLSTAALTPIGSGFSLGSNNSVGVEMDFNPVTDQIRILTAADGLNNNFRANPNTGGRIAIDANLSFAPSDPQALLNFSPYVVAAAHTNSVAGATSSTLVAWDFNRDSLVHVGGVGGNPPSDGGVMTTVSLPPIDTRLSLEGGIGMDVSGATNTLYVVHDDPETGTVSGLYTRDLLTGVESQVGPFASGVFVADLSVFIAPVPEPATTLLVAAGAGLAVRGGRRWITRRG